MEEAELISSNYIPIKSDRDFVFRTIFNPIRGIDEDITEFVSRFMSCNSLRFSKFAEIWKRERFIEVIHGRRHQAGLYDVLGCVFHRLVEFMLPETSRKRIEKICALYMLYAFHGKQPVKNHVRIRVCPDSWKAIVQLATEARDEGHFDVYYVFRQLCAVNAFAFCAGRQVLYPGAPLFDSPQLHKDPPTTSGLHPNVEKQSGGAHRRNASVAAEPNPLAVYFQLLQFPKSSHPTLADTLKSLDASLLRYTEAKRALNPPTEISSIREKPMNREGSGEDSDDAEEFLPGLNFITYPGCLRKVFETLKRLQESEDYHTSLKKESGLGSDDCIDSSDDCQVVGNLTSDQRTPEDPVSNNLVASTSAKRALPKRARLRSDTVVEPITDTSADVSPKQEEDYVIRDVGERRRLLRQPSTWSEELATQAEAVRALGHHRDRRRPTEPKVLKRLRDRRSR